MSAEISLQATLIMVGSREVDGQIVFSNGRLVAVLVFLSGAFYEEAEDHWFLEAGLGPCADKSPEPFETLEEAIAWIGESVRSSEADRLGSS